MESVTRNHICVTGSSQDIENLQKNDGKSWWKECWCDTAASQNDKELQIIPGKMSREMVIVRAPGGGFRDNINKQEVFY